MSDDLELLRRYAKEGAEEAFAELTRRHLPLVYSAALRQVRSPQLAEEVAQSVFLDLARSQAALKPGTILAAWLYRVACRTATDVVRRESRRQVRERLAHDCTAMTHDDASWNDIEPLLDEAMTALDEQDRAAVLLRYFQGKTFREVGAALGASEDAAQKRVSRALERLREFMGRRGVTVSVVVLGGVIAANAVHAAPATLLTAITSSAAVSGVGTTASAAATTTKAIAMTTLQKTLVAAALLAAAGTTVFEAHQARQTASETAALQRGQAPMLARVEALQRQCDEASNALALVRAENQQFRRQQEDLARLRAEVARLRQETNAWGQSGAGKESDPGLAAAARWEERLGRLKARLAQDPSAQIPELALLKDKDWLDAAKSDLNTEADYRQALADLRSSAEAKFMRLLQGSLQKYMAANGQQFPTDLSQIQNYFDPPIDPAMLERYTIKPASASPNVGVGSDEVVMEKAPADPEYDTHWVVGPEGMGSDGSYQSRLDNQVLQPVYAAYRADHKGAPTDPAALAPYITTPEQAAALQRQQAHAARQ